MLNRAESVGHITERLQEPVFHGLEEQVVHLDEKLVEVLDDHLKHLLHSETVLQQSKDGYHAKTTQVTRKIAVH